MITKTKVVINTIETTNIGTWNVHRMKETGMIIPIAVETKTYNLVAVGIRETDCIQSENKRSALVEGLLYYDHDNNPLHT